MDTAETNQAEAQDDLNAVEADERIVRAELQRVMQNRRFSGAPQMSSFLKYIVEQTLNGNGNRIKAYSVGVDALGKPASFDAQTDPSVRVLALRLRKTLAELYLSEEKPFAIIVLNVGSYAPEFYKAEQAIRHELEDLDDQAYMSAADTKAICPFTMVGERHPSQDETLNFSGHSASTARSSFVDYLLRYRHPGVILAVLTCAVWLWGSSTQATGITEELSRVFTGPVVPSLYIHTTEQQSKHVKEVASLLTNSLVHSQKFNLLTSAQRRFSNNNRNYRLMLAEFFVDGQPRIDAQIVHESSGFIIFSHPLLFDTNVLGFSLSEMQDISRLAANISMTPGPVYDDFCEKTLNTKSCDY